MWFWIATAALAVLLVALPLAAAWLDGGFSPSINRDDTFWRENGDGWLGP